MTFEAESPLFEKLSQMWDTFKVSPDVIYINQAQFFRLVESEFGLLELFVFYGDFLCAVEEPEDE